MTEFSNERISTRKIIKYIAITRICNLYMLQTIHDLFLR